MMCKIFKKTSPLILVLLELCSETYGQSNCTNFTIHDLRLICGMTDGDSKIDTFPAQCTAIAGYSNDNDRFHEAYKKKGSLPFVAIVDSIDFNHDSSLDKFNKDAKDINADFIVFDIQAALNIDSYLSQEDLLGAFIDNARKSSGKSLLGLLLHHDISKLEKHIDIEILNGLVDFFLLQSTGYADCKFHVHQRDMATLATKDNVQSSIQELKDKKLDISRLVFTIELKIESRTMYIADSKHMGYSYLCSHKLSVNRKYCFNTVDCLFEKARLRVDFNVLGVFIMGLEYDDVDGTCGCKTASDTDPKFRGFKTIAGASNDGKNGVDYYQCKEGSFPVIL